MGATNSSEMGAKTTALEVVRHFGEGAYLKGKTAVVTGGNSGIGLEACKALASAGARVILCSRSVKNGTEAVETEVKQEGVGGYVVAEPNIEVKQLDLNSLKSVKALAEDLLKEERIDYLVLNAGIMALPQLEHTEDGFEKQIGVNHFGHFYLTQLLRSKLEAQSFPSRVVVLASTAHTMGNVDVNDLHYANGRAYSGWPAYGQSKLANILFAKELADQTAGTQITACSVHPGVIQTNLWRSTLLSGVLSPILNFFIADKTIPQGAATTVWACLSPSIAEADRGAYCKDCAPALPNAAGQDEDKSVRKALWKVTAEQIAQATEKF